MKKAREWMDSEVHLALRRYLDGQMTGEQFAERIDAIRRAAGEIARVERRRDGRRSYSWVRG